MENTTTQPAWGQVGSKHTPYTVSLNRRRKYCWFVALGGKKLHIHHKDSVDGTPRFTLCGRDIPDETEMHAEYAMSSERICKQCLKELQEYRGIEYMPIEAVQA